MLRACRQLCFGQVLLSRATTPSPIPAAFSRREPTRPTWSGWARVQNQAGSGWLSTMRATADDPSGSASSAQEQEGAGIDSASHRHAPALFLGWGVASASSAYVALSHGVPHDLVLLMDTTFWLAVLSSISLTEAWVKFRAPLLERWVGVDVGRRVFRAQYAMEGALAGTAAAVLCQQGGSLAGGAALLAQPPGWLLAGAGATLLLDAAAVFPALDLRGKNLIASSAQSASLSPRQQAYVAALGRSVAGRSLPPAQLHVASIMLAFARAGLLAGYVWQLLLLQAGTG